jgi:hypothetical protein
MQVVTFLKAPSNFTILVEDCSFEHNRVSCSLSSSFKVQGAMPAGFAIQAYAQRPVLHLALRRLLLPAISATTALSQSVASLHNPSALSCAAAYLQSRVRACVPR